MYCRLHLKNRLHWNFISKRIDFNFRKCFANVVCKIAAILLRPQCVKFVSYMCYLSVDYSDLNLSSNSLSYWLVIEWIIYRDVLVAVGTARLILGLGPANKRRRYKVKPSLIGWAQTVPDSTKPLPEPFCLLMLEFKCHLRYCSSQEVDVSLSHSAVLHYTLPEPMLTYHQRCSVAFSWGQFHRNCSRYQFKKWVSKLHFWKDFFDTSQWVKRVWGRATVDSRQYPGCHLTCKLQFHEYTSTIRTINLWTSIFNDSVFAI